MPYIYLHGPNAGKTMNVGGVNFVKGVANIGKISNRLRSMYNVQDYAPVGEIKVEEKVDSSPAPVVETAVEEPVVEVVVEPSIEEIEGADILRQVIKEKKDEIETGSKRLLTYEEIGNIGKFRKYVKDITGIFPKNRKDGEQLLAKVEANQ